LKLNFNLIVSTYRHKEKQLQDELLDLLREFGDPNPHFEITSLSGILLVYTKIDPFEVVRRFKQLTYDTPWTIQYTLRVIPVEMAVKTKLGEITNGIKKLILKMEHVDTFRITIEKRHNNALESSEITRAIGKEIDNTVNLKKPDWIILVEIVEQMAGISVLRSNQIFSSIVEKRNNALVSCN
jgi:tRNA acetyltransferase TAN1